MGRARLGRFAAVTVPAAAVSVGLGYAVLTGMVSAQLTSANGFTLSSDKIAADALKVRPGTAPDAAGGATVYAETTKATADGLDVVTNPVDLGVFGCYGLKIGSTTQGIDLGDVALNAKTLTTPTGATLADVTLGQDEGTIGFKDTTGAGYNADGTGLQSGAASLPDVTAKAYAVSLDGLAVDNLSLGVESGTC